MLPICTLERLCKIFQVLERYELDHIQAVSSRDLEKCIHATSVTIRKDISAIGRVGVTKRGYDVIELKKHIGEHLKLFRKRRACLVGLGRIGGALLEYQTLQDDGFEIIAGFDNNVNKVERMRTDIRVYPVHELVDIVKSHRIELGIIAVPGEAAQKVADQLNKAGIKGILNFSPVGIALPDRVIVENIDFTTALRILAAKMG